MCSLVKNRLLVWMNQSKEFLLFVCFSLIHDFSLYLYTCMHTKMNPICHLEVKDSLETGMAILAWVSQKQTLRQAQEQEVGEVKAILVGRVKWSWKR